MVYLVYSFRLSRLSVVQTTGLQEKAGGFKAAEGRGGQLEKKICGSQVSGQAYQKTEKQNKIPQQN